MLDSDKCKGLNEVIDLLDKSAIKVQYKDALLTVKRASVSAQKVMPMMQYNN